MATVQINCIDNTVQNITCIVDREKLKDLKDTQFGTIDDRIDCEKIINDEFNNNVNNIKYIRTELYRNKPIKVYEVQDAAGLIYTVGIDINTGEIVVNRSNICTFGLPGPEGNVPQGESAEGTFTQERGVKQDIDIFKLDHGRIDKQAGYGEYVLHDESRNITVFDERMMYQLANEINVDGEGLIDVGKALFKIGVWWTYDTFNIDPSVLILFKTPDTSERAAASEGYKHFQTAYDWYNKELGIRSFDNNGSSILIFDDYGGMSDNAAFVGGGDKFFILCKRNRFKYSLCTDLAVIGHEYTHAVFDQSIGQITDPQIELRGINEGCADVFGLLMQDTTDWTIGHNELDGKEVIIRDVANYTGDNVVGKAPNIYHGEGWEEEEHTISVLIQHIAYEMDNSGEFTREDIANIWLTSMQLGYNGDQTFVDCRKNVIKSMEILGYSKELMDDVARWWDAEEIYDDDYIITTEDRVKRELSEKGIELSEVVENNVVLTQPIGLMVQNVSIYIWNCGDEENNKDFDTEFSKILTDKLGKPVVYKTIQYNNMKILKSVILKTDSFVENSVYESLNKATGGNADLADTQILDFMVSLCYYTDELKGQQLDIYTACVEAGEGFRELDEAVDELQDTLEAAKNQINESNNT